MAKTSRWKLLREIKHDVNGDVKCVAVIPCCVSLDKTRTQTQKRI